MWKYIKDNNLQDPKNKQMIKCDDKLSKVGQSIGMKKWTSKIKMRQFKRQVNLALQHGQLQKLLRALEC